jgi:hypothetical protein
MLTSATMGVSVNLAATELDNDMVNANLVSCDARIATQI